MRVALDTSILAYAEGVGDAARFSASHALLAALPGHRIVLPAQTLGELFRVLTGKQGIRPAKAREAVLSWSDAYEVHASTHTAFLSAMDLAADHAMQIWDGLIVSVAVEAGCRFLLSEDMQHGFTWRGLTILNPFAKSPHPLFETLISSA